jgi:hypothetical protein
MNESENFTVNSVTIRDYLGHGIQFLFLSTAAQFKNKTETTCDLQCPVSNFSFFYDHSTVDEVQNLI